MTSPKDPSAPLQISTDAFPTRQRLAMWREVYGRNIANVDIETIGDEPFHASVTFQGLPGVGVVSGSRSAAHYRITRQHLAHPRDLIGLSVLTSGASTTSQLGREIVGRPGTAVVISGTDPSVSTMHRLGSFLTFALPRSEMSALVPDLGAAYARQIPAENEALRLLVRYIETLHQAGPLKTPGLAQAAATHIVDLAALAIGANADAAYEAQQRGVAAARLHAIKTEIRDNHGDSNLSVALIAVRHGVTPRYVHKLFERDGTTFSAFVLTSRLERALRMLKDLRFMTHTISAIAFECGFSDLSYFNRTFRRAYNATPSDIRHAALRAR
jgi:AraC-like DNA-binding protein